MNKEEFFRRYSFNRNTDLLGEGSFGSVYKAYDTLIDQWVAVKISPIPSSGKSRLAHEVQLVASLPSHPNIARYTDFFSFADPTGPFDAAILQYYSEGSLEDILSRRDDLSPAVKLSIISQIIKGLQFIHDNGIVHRDLKPSNILMAVRPDGSLVPKITDFGISSVSLPDNDDTVKDAGTISYSSPEQLNGQATGAPSDFWSLGVIAYRLATGRLPFETPEDNTASLAGKARIITRITSVSLPADTATLPAPWKKIVTETLRLYPAERADAQALHRIIAAIPASSGGGGNNGGNSSSNNLKGNSKPLPPINPAKKKNKGKIITSIIVLFLLLLVAAIVLKEKINSSEPKRIEMPTFETAPAVESDAATEMPVISQELDTVAVEAWETEEPEEYEVVEEAVEAYPDSVAVADY